MFTKIKFLALGVWTNDWIFSIKFQPEVGENYFKAKYLIFHLWRFQKKKWSDLTTKNYIHSLTYSGQMIWIFRHLEMKLWIFVCFWKKIVKKIIMKAQVVTNGRTIIGEKLRENGYLFFHTSFIVLICFYSFCLGFLVYCFMFIKGCIAFRDICVMLI